MVVLLALIVVAIMAVDFDLGDCNGVRKSFRSNTPTRVGHSKAVLNLASLRDKREFGKTSLTASEIREVVEAHNKRRRMEKAVDMEIMSWSPFLAAMAEDWAKNCLWEHGQPQRDPSTLPYSWIGQNLYAITVGLQGAHPINLTAAIHKWYDEKAFYDYDSQQCRAGKVCGHYTQIVWSKSREVGCAYTHCQALRGFSKPNALYLVCNYGPGGNIIGEKPYRRGIPCSKCETGSQWCSQGLCNRNCVKSGTNCECSPTCLNNGNANKKTCSCSCPAGWYGTDCSIICRNHDSKCGPPPGVSGWPPSWCNHPQHGALVREKCPVMCKLCRGTSG